MVEHESHVEHVQEQVHHQGIHSGEGWIKLSAISAAIFAVLAAICSLQSSQYADDAMVSLIEAGDQWEYYQAKGIKALLLQNEQNILQGMGREFPTQHAAQLERYNGEQKKIEDIAKAKEKESEFQRQKHSSYSHAVTLFQVAIAMIAISVLSKRWYILSAAYLLGTGASYFLYLGAVF